MADEANFIPLPASIARIVAIFLESPIPGSRESAEMKAYMIDLLKAHRDCMIQSAKAFSEPLHGIQPGAAPEMKAYVDRFEATARMVEGVIASLERNA